ncbi:hypothetical protein HY382_02335 [Candidatus Curtissbacteria bacterium]|nr:hypothetical protein [Candidatus Curtissbacteria bacterium]
MASSQESEKPALGVTQNKFSRRKLLALGVGGALGLGIAAACGEDQDRTGVEQGYFTQDENFENVGVDEKLVEEDLRLKDNFEYAFNKSSAELLGNEVGFLSYGGAFLDYGNTVVCKVKNKDGSVSAVRFNSIYKSKIAVIELEHQIPGQEPTVQIVYNETRLQVASELIDRNYPLVLLSRETDWDNRVKVTNEEWEEFGNKVRAIVSQAVEDKKSQGLAISEEEKAAASEIVAKYDRCSQEAIDLELENLDGDGRRFPYPRTWNFDQVSQYLSLYIRNDEKQQLVFRNFYSQRDPEVVGVTNPTTRTIFLNDGNIAGSIFIGQDRTAWWYDHHEKPVWSPLTLEELNRASQAITEVFERVKLKESL